MNLSEQQYIILFSLIRFYACPQDELLRKFYGDKLYLEANKVFKEEFEVFVNKKIALDRIYTSLNNASQTYISFRQMQSNGTIGMQSSLNESKVFMSFNESFISALIINFSKLKEVLTIKKKLITKDDLLCDSFAYLDDLNNRIINSGLIDLRNGWFAHAYENERKAIVYLDNDIRESVFRVLRSVCSERYRDEFDKSRDRLRFFCEKHLIEAYTTFNLGSLISDIVNGTNKSEINVSTKPKEIIRELNSFSKIITDVKLLGIESMFIVEDNELNKWSSNPGDYFKENIRLMK